MNPGVGPPIRLLGVMSSLLGGGAEQQMSLVMRHLDRTKFAPTLCLFARQGPFLDAMPADVSVLDLQKRSRRDAAKLIWRLARLIRSEAPDVIYSRGDYANEVASFARRLTRSSSALVVSEESVQSRAIPSMRLRYLRRPLLRLAYRRADAVVAPSPGAIEDVRRIAGLEPTRCHVVPNMVDPSELRAAARARVQNPFAASKLPLIVSAGRLREEKGHADLLAAMRLLIADRPCNLILLGEGPQRARLEALRREFGLESNVSLPGFTANPYPLIKAADVFVSASLYESFGNSILEAMTLGTPVVSSDVPSGPRWLIEDGTNGLLCRPGHPASLAETIATALGDSPLRATLVRGGTGTVERFTAAAAVGALEEVLVGSIRSRQRYGRRAAGKSDVEHGV